MGHEALMVAEHILYLRQDRSTTSLELNKLAFLAHGWTLGYSGQPLIEEPAQAWQFGPVFPSIYHRFKSYGAGAITMPARSRDGELGEYHAAMVKVVIDGYKRYSAGQLVTITHKDDSPWRQVWVSSGPGSIIPNHLIRHYYETRRREMQSVG